MVHKRRKWYNLGGNNSKDLKDKIVNFKTCFREKRKENIIDVVSAYAPQVKFDESIKRQIWERINSRNSWRRENL